MRRAISFFDALLVIVALVSRQAWAEDSPAQVCARAYVDGQLLQKDHKLLQARDAFRVCAQPTCKDFMVRDCLGWLDEVESHLGAITPVAVDELGETLVDAHFTMDGAPLVSLVDGHSVTVDPGSHMLRFETPDGRTASETVIVRESDRNVRVTATFARLHAAPAAPVELRPSPTVPVGPATSPSSAHASPWRNQSELGPWKVVGIGTLGLGALGLAVGAWFGLDAISKENAAGCGSNGACPSVSAAEEFNAARRAGNNATGFLVVGGGLAVIGTGVWLFAPARSIRASATLESGGASLEIDGAF